MLKRGPVLLLAAYAALTTACGVSKTAFVGERRVKLPYFYQPSSDDDPEPTRKLSYKTEGVLGKVFVQFDPNTKTVLFRPKPYEVSSREIHDPFVYARVEKCLNGQACEGVDYINSGEPFTFEEVRLIRKDGKKEIVPADDKRFYQIANNLNNVANAVSEKLRKRRMIQARSDLSQRASR